MSRKHERSAWKHIRHVFNARVDKWSCGEIDDYAMWQSINNACKNNPIENINKDMTINEAIEHIQKQLQILYDKC